MILCVFGSRKGVSYADVEEAVSLALYCWHLSVDDITKVVEGEAPGADLLGKKWAEDRGIPVDPYPAKWDDLTVRPIKIKQGPRGPYNALAGFQRNDVMADVATHFVGLRRPAKSSGTDDMVKRVVFRKKPAYLYHIVCPYDTDGDGNCGRRHCVICS